ncbi:MAG: LCP family protein [Streptococcaceae bacterium]|nr:LCP family protein [Streptococcaceae bacterium]
MKLWIKNLIMIGSILLLTAIAGLISYKSISDAISSAGKKTFINVGNNNNIKATEPLTIVLMGVDTGGAGRGNADSWDGNSDSQIVITLNPKTNTTTMVSMERDTMTNILDANNQVVSTQKMNAAYPMGYNQGDVKSGAQYAMNTIGEQAGVPIDNFVIMNFDGLTNLVNDVGGITVDNTSGGDIYIYDTEPNYTSVVKPGVQNINGDQALVYARDRHTLANGDYGRAAHQREIITQVMKKMISMDNLTQYQKFLNDISKDFKTNINVTPDNLANLYAYKDCFNKVVSVHYQGVGASAAGSDGAVASYQFMPENVDLAVQNTILLSLGKSPITTLNPNVITYESQFGAAPATYFMPSATVTEKGKTPVTYGIDSNGKLIPITSQNSGTYVGENGDAAANTGTSSSSSSSTNESSSTNQ